MEQVIVVVSSVVVSAFVGYLFGAGVAHKKLSLEFMADAVRQAQHMASAQQQMEQAASKAKEEGDYGEG